MVPKLHNSVIHVLCFDHPSKKNICFAMKNMMLSLSIRLKLINIEFEHLYKSSVFLCAYLLCTLCMNIWSTYTFNAEISFMHCQLTIHFKLGLITRICECLCTNSLTMGFYLSEFTDFINFKNVETRKTFMNSLFRSNSFRASQACTIFYEAGSI